MQALSNSLKLCTIPGVLLQPNPEKGLNLPLCTLQNYTKLSGNRPKSFYFLFTPCYETAKKAPGCFLLPGSWNVQLLEVFKQNGEAWTHCPCKGQLNSTVLPSQSQEVSSSDKIKIVYSVIGQPTTLNISRKGWGKKQRKKIIYSHYLCNNVSLGGGGLLIGTM